MDWFNERDGFRDGFSLATDEATTTPTRPRTSATPQLPRIRTQSASSYKTYGSSIHDDSTAGWSTTASNCSRRMCELSLPHFPKARCDHPSRRDEFRARDLPPQLRGLYTDAGVGLVRCVSSSEVFRSNDYSKLGAHWYHGQKKAYATKHQCRRTGELVQKRIGSPKVYWAANKRFVQVQTPESAKLRNNMK